MTCLRVYLALDQVVPMQIAPVKTSRPCISSWVHADPISTTVPGLPGIIYEFSLSSRIYPLH